MLIALIHNADSAHLQQTLSLLGEIKVFANQSELQDYLLTDAPCDLVVSATDGALGMNCCTMAHDRRVGVPILWITEQKEFEPQSFRTPVDAFLVKPVEPSTVFSIADKLLHKPPRATPDMVETLAFCCRETKKRDYFKLIWDHCVSVRKFPAIHHAADAEEFWQQMETQPVEGVLILLPDTEGKALYEQIRERCPDIRKIYFYTPEGEEPTAEEHSLPYPVTRERMEQALTQLDIVPSVEDSPLRRVVTRPGCITETNIKASIRPRRILAEEKAAIPPLPPPKKIFSEWFRSLFQSGTKPIDIDIKKEEMR